jgi:hypothetical protein
MADFVADFLQNWLEDNVSESIYNGMKTTVESLITKETFDTKVIELFDSYIDKRLESFEEQLNKLETTE